MAGLTRRVVALLLFVAVAGQAEDEKKGRKLETRRLKMEARAGMMSAPSAKDELSNFLARETQRLIERSRTLSGSPYEQDRVLEALDDLLDARDDLVAAGQPNRDGKKTGDPQRSTAKSLERAYFRIQQGEYFAKLSGDARAGEYVVRARRLYQMARAAYDVGGFHRATKLGSAGAELVNVLENLAQAVVRRPEPPVLE